MMRQVLWYKGPLVKEDINRMWLGLKVKWETTVLQNLLVFVDDSRKHRVMINHSLVTVKWFNRLLLKIN